MTIVQLVPQLPPVLEGVGTFAAALARALERRGVESRFLVGAADWPGGGDPAGEPVAAHRAAALERQLAGSGAAAAGAGTLLVHYANYGYQRRGCPIWLVAGVRRWRRGGSGRRLVTFFHEVYASGPPWRSSFWLSPVQRRLAASLLQASDAAVTSLAIYRGLLRRWEPWREVLLAPVISAVGEPAGLLPAAERRPRTLAVFGAPQNRRRAYGELREALATACRRLGIAEILDIGSPCGLLPPEVGGAPVRPLGELPAPAVSAVLAGCFAGFLGYPAAFLAKSSVFAAYCAHGMLPVTSWHERRGRRHGPAPGDVLPPCWDPAVAPLPADPAALAAGAHAWYRRHDGPSLAAAMATLLQDGATAPAGRGRHAVAAEPTGA
jgi:hypothetical protein